MKGDSIFLDTPLIRNSLSIFDNSDIKDFLDSRVNKYNQTDFIHADPVQIPHHFSRKEDIEIAGFLTATISWGQRKSIINNANRLMELMDNSPYEFLMETSIHSDDLKRITHFVHRTFN